MARLRHPYHYNMFRKHLMKSSRPVHHMLKTAMRIGASLRTSSPSLKQQKLSWDPKKSEHQDWFDENDECITQLLHAKNQACMEWQNDPSCKSKEDKFGHPRGQAQKGLCKMKDHWWDRMADEVQKYADSYNSKQFFRALKTVYGPTQSGLTPLLSTDGSTLIKDQEGLREWWAEHFSNLLNRPSSVSGTALDQIPQHPTLDELDHLPSVIEIKKAIHQVNSNQAPGKDRIPAELYKVAGPEAINVFHDVLSHICEQENMPEDFWDALIVALYKKGQQSQL